MDKEALLITCQIISKVASDILAAEAERSTSAAAAEARATCSLCGGPCGAVKYIGAHGQICDPCIARAVRATVTTPRRRDDLVDHVREVMTFSQSSLTCMLEDAANIGPLPPELIDGLSRFARAILRETTILHSALHVHELDVRLQTAQPKPSPDLGDLSRELTAALSKIDSPPLKTNTSAPTNGASKRNGRSVRTTT